MSHKFSGKVAFVTGAGGTGGAVAKRLAEEGAMVVAGVRQLDPAEPLDADLIGPFVLIR